MKMKIKELVGILTLTAILGGMAAVGFAQADDDEFNIEPEQPAVEPAVEPSVDPTVEPSVDPVVEPPALNPEEGDLGDLSGTAVAIDNPFPLDKGLKKLQCKMSYDATVFGIWISPSMTPEEKQAAYDDAAWAYSDCMNDAS